MKNHVGVFFIVATLGYAVVTGVCFRFDLFVLRLNRQAFFQYFYRLTTHPILSSHEKSINKKVVSKAT